MRTSNYVLFAAADLSASFNSKAIPVENMTVVAIQAVVSSAGSLSGAWQLQASCDVGLDDGTGVASNITNWSNVGASTAVTTNGITFVTLADIGARWLRLAWTFTAGTGAASARVNAKGF